MRGEHDSPKAKLRALRGSSPHARGALPDLDGAEQLAGIIPACAGSTSPIDTVVPAMGDHPRMRGEHVLAAHALGILAGSSPHARGAPPELGDGA